MKLLKLINLLIKSKYRVIPPPKKKIVIFDYQGANRLINVFNKIKKNECEILHSRGEIINLIIIIKILLKLNINRHNYYLEYIKATECNYVLTFIDNSFQFYKLKKKFPNIKFIAFQNGWRDNVFFKTIHKRDNLSADYIFCYNSSIKKKYEKNIKANVISHGSIINNKFENKLNDNSNEIFFISQIIDNKNQNFLVDDKYISWSDFFKVENLLFQILIKQKFFKNKKLIILSRYREFNKIEFDFYDNIFNKKEIAWDFKIINKIENVYKFCLSKRYFISIDSTLGYELLSRNKKVFFISSRVNVKRSSRSFGWPYNFNNTGYFWSNLNKKNSKNLSKNINNYFYKEKIFDTKFIHKNLMNYDKKNIEISKQLNLLGLKL